MTEPPSPLTMLFSRHTSGCEQSQQTISAVARLFDHFLGAGEHCSQDFQAERSPTRCGHARFARLSLTWMPA